MAPSPDGGCLDFRVDENGTVPFRRGGEENRLAAQPPPYHLGAKTHRRVLVAVYRVSTGRRNGIFFRTVAFSLSTRWAFARSLTLMTATIPPLTLPAPSSPQ
jgi:hypothetical protein